VPTAAACLLLDQLDAAILGAAVLAVVRRHGGQRADTPGPGREAAMLYFVVKTLATASARLKGGAGGAKSTGASSMAMSSK
jgi:hypothetical protein